VRSRYFNRNKKAKRLHHEIKTFDPQAEFEKEVPRLCASGADWVQHGLVNQKLGL
jgi:hypothetical protein